MKSLLIEGWRQITHSYAIVNQSLILEFLKNQEITLCHRDLPFPFQKWRPYTGLLSSEREDAIAKVPPPSSSFRPDVVLRIGYPIRLNADPIANRTFVWGTSEFSRIMQEALDDRLPIRDTLANSESKIITCSNWSRSGFVNSGADPSNVKVIPCGVDPSIFHPVSSAHRAAIRKQFGWEDKFVILNIGSMTQNKGINLLLRSVAAILPKHQHLYIVLKGSDSLYRSKEFAQTNFVSLSAEETSMMRPHIAYTGGVFSENKLAELYQAADAYVSPYLAEGFSLPVLEAAACGLPVICTQGGPTDEFTDPSFALYVSSKIVRTESNNGAKLEPSLSMLTAQIERLISDVDFRVQASQAGPEWVRSRFTWKHSADLFLSHMFPD